MDYRTLNAFRESLEAYALAVSRAPNKSGPSPILAVIHQTANNLPTPEVIRELETLPSTFVRLVIVREVCQLPSLRRAALTSSLLKAPRKATSRAKRNWYKALGHLVDKWKLLESENADEQVLSELRQLRKQVEQELPDNGGNALSLATLLVTADARLEKVEKLQRRINKAVALLENGQLAYAHDGLQEVVQALWAQIRSKYPEMMQLTKAKVEGSERDAVISRVENAIAELRARHTSLSCMGFQLPGLEVATGKGRECDDEEDEDEWEDAWEEPVKFDDMGEDNDENHANAERAIAKPSRTDDGIENFLKGKVGGNRESNDLDPLHATNWMGATKGGKGNKFNRLLLDRMDETAALELNRDGPTGVVSDVVHRGRGVERDRGRRGGKKAGSTARQRLRAALGIKKRKKKSLLD